MTGSEWRPNPAQAAAVAHVTGPLRIQAGAGSGKTTTLVRRILALLAGGHCRAGEVLMLTFTTRAVADMRAKVAAALPADSEQPRIETYHAFALGLVREFAHHLALPPEPALLTEGPVKLFARLHFDRLGLHGLDLSRLQAAVSDTLEFFGWHRHEGTFRQPAADLLARLGADDNPALPAQFLAAHERYRELLREKGAADYDDLIALAVELLEGQADVRRAVPERYRFLLVDEYQDTDHLQGRFIQLLAAGHGNVTIVGDPDQTIYSFRGAAMSNILHFDRLHPGLADIDMVTNYRSTPAIVAAANAVIAQNTRRKAAALAAGRAQGDLPRPLLVTAPDFPTEAAWVAAEMQRLHAGGVAWREMAVLVRSNRHKLPLYAGLLQAGVPARVVGGLDLFADPETARLIFYLRVLAVPEQDADLTVALGLPRYGLTDAAIAGVARQRADYRERLIDVVARLAPGRPQLRAFLDEFWGLYRLRHAEGCLAAIRGALALHASSLSPQARLNAEQLLPLAEAFLERAELFVPPEAAPLPPLALLMQYLDALRDVGEPPEGAQLDVEGEAVKLMTVHAAKGLEFPVVFVPRLTERDFHPKAPRKWDKPFPLAWHHDPDVAADFSAMMAEEERRLFYVAITRAEDRLYLSWAPVDPARKQRMEPSQFISEVAAACDRLELPGAAEPASGVPAGGEPGSAAPPAATGRPVQAAFDLGALLAPLVSDRPAAPLPAPAAAAPFTPAVPVVYSFSHLSTYQLCPYRFYLQYLLRLPGRPAPAAEAGIRAHAAIERLGAAVLAGQDVSFRDFTAWTAAPPLPTDGDLTGAPPEAGARGRDEPEPAAGGLDFAAALQRFWDSEYAIAAPVAVEQEFHITLGGTVVRGFIDRIHRRADGTVEVVDFKTYNRLLSEAEVKQGLQLPLYIKACREALGLPVRTGAMYFLKHGVAVRVEYTDAELTGRWQEAERLLAAIRAGDWAPTPGAVCRHCPYGEICPAATAPG